VTRALLDLYAAPWESRSEPGALRRLWPIASRS